MESAIESPLDVLSRAATMVQGDSPLHGAGGVSGAPARGPGPTVEPHPPPRCPVRRQQRHSSTSAAAQLYLLVPLSVRAPPRRGREEEVDVRQEQKEEEGERQKGEEEQQRQQYLRPSVITCAPGRPCPPSPPHSAFPRGVQASGGARGDDPDIDEHFRRSLGSDYVHLFSSGDGGRLWQPSPAAAADASTNDSATSSPPSSDGSSSLSIKITGNSVDDHFAKALGETWRKLQEEQAAAAGGAGGMCCPPVVAEEETIGRECCGAEAQV